MAETDSHTKGEAPALTSVQVPTLSNHQEVFHTGPQSKRWKRTRSRHGTARWGTPPIRPTDAIVTSIVKTVDPDRIILFGSAARGTMNDESDLDILVVKDRCRPARNDHEDPRRSTLGKVAAARRRRLA